MFRPDINNTTCAVLRRSSSPGQGTSIGNQGKTIDTALAQYHLTVVCERTLEGVSGSVPGNRTDIEEIIAEKKLHDKFSLLLVPDASRFTRAGAGHGSKMIYELRAAGIMILFVNEDILVHDELTAMYISFLLHAAHEGGKAISRGSTIGTTHSFLKGNSPYCKAPPLGLDRMYSLDGTDLHIIRNLSDGTQHMLHPQTREFIRAFAKNEKKGVPNHYIKQKNEKIRLVSGDPKQVAKIHLIMHLYFIERISYHQTGKRLNDMGILSKMDKEWHTASIRDVLLNPAYVGRGIRYRIAEGIYHNGGEDTATPSGIDLKELNERKNIRQRRRAEKHWREREMPELHDFLPEEVRAMAEAKIDEHLASIADGKPAKPRRDRHLQSSYVLKGILRSKQGGHLMTGRKGKARKYAVSRGHNVQKSNNVLANRVPAEPLEHAVLEAMKLIFNDRDLIVKKLRHQFEQHQKRSKDEDQAPAIEKKIVRKRRQIVVLSQEITGDEEDTDPIMVEIAAVRHELRQLEKQLRNAKSSTTKSPTNPAMAIERLATELQKWINDFQSGASIDPAGVPHVTQILKMLVSKLEVDLVTMEVEIELSIPSWVPEQLMQRQVGLDALSASKQYIEAHPENTVILGVFRCDGMGQPLCFSCRREKKAA